MGSLTRFSSKLVIKFNTNYLNYHDKELLALVRRCMAVQACIPLLQTILELLSFELIACMAVQACIQFYSKESQHSIPLQI